MNHTCAPPYIATCRACDIQQAAEEGPAVGYGCGNRCGGIAYFPSKPGDYCAACIARRAANEPHVLCRKGMGAEDYCAICDQPAGDKRHLPTYTRPGGAS